MFVVSQAVDGNDVDVSGRVEDERLYACGGERNALVGAQDELSKFELVITIKAPFTS
jgi:hypothetical protein